MNECRKWHLASFTISVCRLKYIKVQFQHWALHFAIAFGIGLILSAFNIHGNTGTWVSVFIAFLIEILDGFRKFNDDGNEAEGFNIYPDLVFRCAGAIGGIVF